MSDAGRSGYVTFSVDGVPVRAGFAVQGASLLAGGPVRVEFSVEVTGARTLSLAVGGDRMRQRPGQFEIAAVFEGSALPDPAGQAPFLGGPLGVVQISAARAWSQSLLLNEFVRLELAREAIPDGASGQLVISCRRPLALAGSDAGALLAETAGSEVAVTLEVELRRDDAALADLADGLLERVLHGPVAERERPLAELLSMRSCARSQLERLAEIPDPGLGGKAQAVLQAMVRG